MPPIHNYMIWEALYCEDPEIAELDDLQDDGATIMKGVMPYALEGETAKKTWTLSEELTSIKFVI